MEFARLGLESENRGRRILTLGKDGILQGEGRKSQGENSVRARWDSAGENSHLRAELFLPNPNHLGIWLRIELGFYPVWILSLSQNSHLRTESFLPDPNHLEVWPRIWLGFFGLGENPWVRIITLG